MKNNSHAGKNHSGFAVALTETKDLGNAMLVAEFADGHYEPVAVPINIREAQFR